MQVTHSANTMAYGHFVQTTFWSIQYIIRVYTGGARGAEATLRQKFILSNNYCCALYFEGRISKYLHNYMHLKHPAPHSYKLVYTSGQSHPWSTVFWVWNVH